MKYYQTTFALLVMLLFGACVSTPNAAESDPWESVNRGIYTFNDRVDRVTLKPVAKGYRKVLPGFMRRGVNNFFTNLSSPLTIVNQLLQGKGRAAISDTGRLLLNSTVGVGGLFDPAASAGLEQHEEDFGQTLATWGVPNGPFVMLPLLGPRSLRDAIATPLNLLSHPLAHYDDSSVRDKLLALEAINIRARLLTADGLLKDSADPYVTIRDAYQQNRRYKIFDGDPPDEDDELFDEILESP
jgi:phospholipid-binding lipoprotein MlaA